MRRELHRKRQELPHKGGCVTTRLKWIQFRSPPSHSQYPVKIPLRTPSLSSLPLSRRTGPTRPDVCLRRDIVVAVRHHESASDQVAYI
jgi:hypothetical protein